MPTYTRVHRLLKVLTLIQGERKWTPEKLAEECGVSERTIFRDLNELEAVGIAIKFDQSANSYRVDRDFFLPPIQLTAREAMALMVLCEHLADREQIPFLGQAWQAMAKIQTALPIGIREEMARLADTVVVQTARSMPADGHVDMYERVQSAISSRRALLCRYESLSGSGEDGQFEFEPYSLYFAVRAWYAVGFHNGRGEVRTLKLSRFTMARETGRAYRIPEDYSLESILGNAWRMIRGEKDYDIELLFDASFAETVGDTCWHKTQRIETHDDGTMTMRFRVSGLDEIVWWVLSMGSHCKVIAPAELQDKVQQIASATAARYE